MANQVPLVINSGELERLRPGDMLVDGNGFPLSRPAGANYLFSSSITVGSPGNGFFRLNSATLSAATILSIAMTDNDTLVLSTYQDEWDNSTSTIKGYLTFRNVMDNSIAAVYAITGARTDHTTWNEFPVAFILSSGAFVNGDTFYVTFSRTGDIGTVLATDVQVFTAAGTWNKPTGAKTVQVITIGAGGGGGSGRRGAAATIRAGGGGGGAGGLNTITFNAAAVGATMAVTVGAGGTGGAAQATNNTDGNPGTTGGSGTFGNLIFVRAGAGGSGGTAGATAGGAGGQGVEFGPDGANANASGGAGVSGNAVNIFSPGAGGSGGGISAADAASAGGLGGSGARYGRNPGPASGTAGAIATSGGAGGNTAANEYIGGGGGGGGGSRIVGTPAGSGGAAGNWGAGGGGGGAGVTSVSISGAGGAGGDGLIVVITYF